MKKKKLTRRQKQSVIALKRFCNEFHVGIYVDYLGEREDFYLRKFLYKHFKRLNMLDLFKNYNLIDFKQFRPHPVLPDDAAYEQARIFIDSVKNSLKAYDYILSKEAQ